MDQTMKTTAARAFIIVHLLFWLGQARAQDVKPNGKADVSKNQKEAPVKPDADQLVHYIAGCQSMAGVLVATTLTGFIFLVTRRPVAAPPPPQDPIAEDRELMGPYCLLFSFILALASFIVLSVMMRVHTDTFLKHTTPQLEFDSWLSPFHLLVMMLFLSMAFLAFGTYYVARDWLWITGTPAEVSPAQLAIMGTVSYFAKMGPALVFFYLAISIFALWNHIFLSPPYVAGILYLAAIASLLLVLIPKARHPLTRFGSKPIKLMKSILVVTFGFLVLQQLQNLLWLCQVLFEMLEWILVVIRTVLVAHVVVLMIKFIQDDFEQFKKALRSGEQKGEAKETSSIP
jgi:hypothetical protein